MRVSEKYQATFESRTGIDVLKDLRAQFYDVPNIASEASQHLTTIRAAQRDVVQYILDLVEGRGE